jgi:O-acetyl-ADP-ribose deacetylase (regulator of RNase III)
MKYIEGDLFKFVPQDSDEHVIIAHVCNSIGAWGAGFVIPLAQHYPEARRVYKEAFANNDPFAQLGWTQFVNQDKIIIANMIAQEGVGPSFCEVTGKMQPPIRYASLQQCMFAVRDNALKLMEEGKKVRIAAPMFGSGLAGGDWNIIENMIKLTWEKIDTTVYYLPQFLPSNWNLPK